MVALFSLYSVVLCTGFCMYLVAIAWIYVVLMMSVAEATNDNGTVLGAVFTFILYGLLPLGIVMYIGLSPARARARKAQEALVKEGYERSEFDAMKLAWPKSAESELDDSVNQPDASSHAPTAAEPSAVPPVREKP
jgi:hypothetical protein